MMTRLSILFAFTCASFVLGGCSSPPSIEPGTWQLRVTGYQFVEGDVSAIPAVELMPWTLVNVHIGWKDHRKYGALQTVDIVAADPTAENLDPITGFIEPDDTDGSAYYLNIFGGDENVRFRMKGAVRDPHFVQGSVIGRKRLQKSEGFRGKFQLRHLDEEQALYKRRALEKRIRDRQAEEATRQAQNRAPREPERPPESIAEEIDEVDHEGLPMRPGVWVLKIDGRDLASDTADLEPLLNPSKVQVHIDDDSRSDDLKVKIRFTRGTAGFDPDVKPISGRLRDDEDEPGEYHLNVLGWELPIGDAHYDFRMKSTKVSSNRVEGLVQMRDSARGRHGYEGFFTLQRAR